ncbi:hypothetical protein TPB0596_06430 [Tsukamurella pulmonis]|uniref:hypothetical protein n=1 Tax=Tsukamurella pulmonis TaxID=47312 RepID=UPI001EDD1530|nr:hypothetical protein [Tsukamurella pulmonis]BDD80880.1 hypothetical protein TPB0596_06430 [Tsukamurella pulmonis]
MKETQRATGQIVLHCQRGRQGFWQRFDTVDRIVDFFWTRNPLDLIPWLEFNGPEVWATVDGLVKQWPLMTMWRTNTLTVEAGDRLLRVACNTDKATFTWLYLPVRVLPGQTVTVCYTAPRAKGVPATLGFAPS